MMTKGNNLNNNLFKWATKELSQDAVLAWLLSEDEFGKGLLKEICKDSFKALEIDDFRIQSVISQTQSIDVLVEIEANNEMTAIIIEDKADSFLHDCQMLKYIAKISKDKKKYNNIIFVVFKTGYVFEWEKEEYKCCQKLIKDKLKGERFFSKDDLNDTIENGGNNLIISGGYQKDSITIREDVKIYVENAIYTLEKFNNYIEDHKDEVRDNNKKILEYYLDFINGEKGKENTANKTEDDNYKTIKSLKNISTRENSKDNDIQLRMIRPGGGGKRNYEYCFFSKNFFNYNKLSDKNNINDNYLLLPFIRKTTDKQNTYLFALNYNYIGDLTKQHGYIPYSKLKLSQEQKEEFENFKSEISGFADSIKDKNGITVSKSDKKNRLQLFSFKANEINDDNINKLLKCAEYISKCIQGTEI